MHWCYRSITFLFSPNKPCFWAPSRAGSRKQPSPCTESAPLEWCYLTSPSFSHQADTCQGFVAGNPLVSIALLSCLGDREGLTIGGGVYMGWLSNFFWLWAYGWNDFRLKQWRFRMDLQGKVFLFVCLLAFSIISCEYDLIIVLFSEYIITCNICKHFCNFEIIIFMSINCHCTTIRNIFRIMLTLCWRKKKSQSQIQFMK